MKLKRILSAVLTAAVVFNTMAEPLTTMAMSTDKTMSETKKEFHELLGDDSTTYDQRMDALLEADSFYDAYAKADETLRKKFLESLSDEEAYEMKLYAKYGIVDEFVALGDKPQKEDADKVVDNMNLYAEIPFREIEDTEDLDKKVCEKLTEKHEKDFEDFESLHEYLQEILPVNLNDLLTQIDTFTSIDSEALADTVIKFRNYVYATYGFDESDDKVEEEKQKESKEESPKSEEKKKAEKSEQVVKENEVEPAEKQTSDKVQRTTDSKSIYKNEKKYLQADFFGRLQILENEDKYKTLIDNLTADEAYEMFLYGKYALLDDIMSISTYASTNRERVDLTASYIPYFADVANKAKKANAECRYSVEKTYLKYCSELAEMDFHTFDEYNNDIQKYTNIDVEKTLNQLDKFKDAEDYTKVSNEMQNYLYSMFGLKQPSLRSYAQGNTRAVYDPNNKSTWLPAGYDFRPQFTSNTTVSISNKTGFKGTKFVSETSGTYPAWHEYDGKYYVAWDKGYNSWYKPTSSDNGDLVVTYKNVGSYNGHTVNLRITYETFGGTSTNKHKGMGYGKSNIAFGWPNFNGDISSARYSIMKLEFLNASTGKLFNGIKGYIPINDLDYFDGAEKLELVSGANTFYVDKTNNGKVSISGNIIQAKSGTGGGNESDGANAAYLFNNATHKIKWTGALLNISNKNLNVQVKPTVKVQYHVNGGALAAGNKNTVVNGYVCDADGNRVTKVIPYDSVIGTNGLHDANNPSGINIVRKGYHYESGKQWKTISGYKNPGAVFDQYNETYKGSSFGKAGQTITLYANLIPDRHNVAFDTQGGNINQVNVNGYLMPDSGWYNIKSALGTYIHVRGMDRENGETSTDPNKAQYVSYNGVNKTLGDDNNTMYYLERYKDTQYYFIINARSGKYMQLPGRESTGTLGSNKSYPYQWNMELKPDGEPEGDFLWSFKKVGDYVSIINKGNGLALDVYDASTTNGTPIWMYNPNETNAQQFTLEPHPTYTNPNYHTKYKITNASFNVPWTLAHKTGYTLSSWNTAADGSGTSYEPGANYTHDQNGGKVTLYAQYAPNTYKVMYNKNFGILPPGEYTASSTHTYDVAKALSKNTFVTPKGYRFAGWATSPDGPVVYEDQEVVMNLTTDNDVIVWLYAVWVPDNLTVTYKPNGGVGTEQTQEIEANKSWITKGSIYTKTGYRHTSWNKNSAGTSTEFPLNTSCAGRSSDLTLYAQYSPNTYTIQYNGNGATGGSTASMTHVYDAAKALRQNGFTKTGYTFAGWATSANGSVVYTNKQVVENLTSTHGATITLYAKWTPNTYKVVYNGNGATGGSTATSTHTYDVAKALTANGFTKTGYHFTGWATSASGSVVYSNGQSVKNLTSTNGGTVNLYAKWTPNTYKVVYNGNGATSGSTATSNHTYDTAKALTTNGFTKTGYHFAGWATSASGSVVYSNGQSVKNLTSTNGGTVNLYAKWTPNTYKVVYNGNGATGGSTATSTHTYDVAKALTANGFTKTGYTFAGWATSASGDVVYGNGASVKNLTSTNGGVVNLYAKWTPNTYTVTYKANGGSGSDQTQTVKYNAAWTTKASTFTKTGYTQTSWNTAANGSGTKYSLNTAQGTWTRTSGLILYAQYTPNTYKVVYNGNGATGGSTATSTHTYDVAKALTVNGFTKTGYHFAGWATSASGAVAYTNGQSVKNLTSVNGGTVNLYAKWTPNTYKVVYNGNGATSGSTETSIHTYDVAKNLTKNGFRKSGYRFEGWSTSTTGNVVYKDSQSVKNLTSVNNGEVTLYAKWEPCYIYIDGINGNDSNDGTTPRTSVKTFRQAYTNAVNCGGKIFVVNTVSISKDMTLTDRSYTDSNGTIKLNSDVKSVVVIKRYSQPERISEGFDVKSNTNTMINVVAGNFTLDQITVDGHKDAVEKSEIIDEIAPGVSNAQSIINVSSGATLNVKNGAEIHNNVSIDNGGAIYIAAGGVANILDSNISHNKSTKYGGAIYNNGAVKIIESYLIDNSVGSSGGALFNKGTATVENVGFISNSSDMHGGAICNEGTLDALNTSFFENRSNLGNHNIEGSSGSGGAVFLNKDSNSVFDSCSFSDNNYDLEVKQGVTEYAEGGAIYSWGGNFEVHNSDFHENKAESGGAIKIYDGHLHDGPWGTKVVIDTSTFTGNKAISKFGGAIHSLAETLTISNSDFTVNESVTNGGAITVTASKQDSVKFENITLSLNRTLGNGGGIWIDGQGSAKILDSVIASNYADELEGGGIYNETTLSINDSTIEGNSAANAGGGIRNNDGIIFMKNTNVLYNESEDGSGIYNTGTLDMEGGEIVGNVAQDPDDSAYGRGGGISHSSYNDHTLSLKNVKIEDNLAGEAGGGIHIDDGNTKGNVNIENCIVNNNTATDGGGIFFSNYVESITADIDDTSITNNIAHENGGGIYNGAGKSNDYDVDICIKNGNISDNQASLGEGIYQSGALQIQGELKVDTGNDIYLEEDKFIKVNGPLTSNEGLIAKFTPEDYFNGRKIVEVAYDNMTATDEFTYADGKEKFTLTPNADFALRPGDKLVDAAKVADTDIIISSECSITYKKNTEHEVSSMPEPTKLYWQEKGKISSKVPEREDYTFQNWNTSQDGTGTLYNKGQEITLADSITVYAQWKPAKVVVVYNANSGTGASGNKEVVENVPYDKSENYLVRKNASDIRFSKKQNTFMGWDIRKDSKFNTPGLLRDNKDNYVNLKEIANKQAEAEKNAKAGRSGFFRAGDNIATVGVTETGVPEVTFYATWDEVPVIEGTDTVKEFYEGTTVTRADLLKGISAKDDGGNTDISSELKIKKIEYAAGRMVGGVAQKAYVEEWPNGMPADAKLDTWFMELDKEKGSAAHKVTFEVKDPAGQVVTATQTVKVKYNEFPTITAQDRYFTLDEAQNGVITKKLLLDDAIGSDEESADVYADDDEEGQTVNNTSHISLVDFNADEFKNFTESGYRKLTFKVQDTYGPGGKGKEAYCQMTVYVIKDGEIPEVEKAKEVRFISEKYYDLNKDLNPDSMTDAQKEEANDNGGLNVDSKWYKDPEYKALIEATFGKTTGDHYQYELEDLDKMRDFVDEHGVGNAQEADGLSKFADQFMTGKYKK